MRKLGIQFCYPHLCLLCHDIILKNSPLCSTCEKNIPPAKEIQQPGISKTIILFNYEFPFNRFITQLKFGEDLAYAKLLGNLFAKTLPSFYSNTSLPELIIPVPLHPQRLRERGYNQSLEIAKFIGKKYHIPIDKNNLIRTKNTPAQSLLSKTDRLHNLKDAFTLKQSMKKKYTHIVLIDDVTTTGETLKEITKILKRDGITKIDIWCAAQTLLP